MQLIEGRISMFVILIVFISLIIYSIFRASKVPVKVKSLPGLEHMKEGVARAAELGRPVHWTTGYGLALHGGGLSSRLGAALIAGLSIFNYIAKLCAQMNAEILATFCTAELMPSAMQSVKEIYISEGKLENFKPENFIYLSSTQFAYAAAVMSLMETENVATNIFCGSYQAETVLLAEAGAQLGCYQIAGSTGSIAYFMITCDYVLISEEFLTAAAILAEDVAQLGAIRGQDISKLVVMAMLLVLSILLSIGIDLTGILRM